MKPSIKLRLRPRHWFLAASFLILPALAPAAGFHVATDGDDKQPGTHCLPDTPMLTAADSGSEEHPAFYQAVNGGQLFTSTLRMKKAT